MHGRCHWLRTLQVTTVSAESLLLYLLFGQKNHLFGITPAKHSQSGPNSVYVDRSRGDRVQGILGAIGPFWAKWGLGYESRGVRVFFRVVIQTTFRQLCSSRFWLKLATKRSSVHCRWIRKVIFENFHFMGHLPPKSEIARRSNRHLTQSRLHVTGCTAEKYCLLHVVVHGPGNFRAPINFFVRRTVLAYLPHINPKKYLPVNSLQPRGDIAEWSRFFNVVVEGPKGCLPAAEFSCDFR